MPVNSFVDERLPDDVERGAKGGPGFKTSIITLDSGFERRNATWAKARGNWDIGYGIQHKDDYDAVLNFFYARRGMLVGFRFKDWTDYQVNQIIALNDTSGTKVYQVFKQYVSGGEVYNRTLTKIVAGSYQVYKSGNLLIEKAGTFSNSFQLDINTGLLTLGAALGSTDSLQFVGEFDVPVRFNTDQLDITAETWETGEIPALPVIEIK